MSLTFIKAGLQTSIQDIARVGQMHLGISASGAMDSRAMKLANRLVGKPSHAATIEVTLVGPTIQAECDIAIAVCGAQFELFHQGKPVVPHQVINLSKGDILEFKRCLQGARAYIGFTGELDLPPVMASYSTHLTANFGCINGAIEDNQRLPIKGCHPLPPNVLEQALRPNYSGNYLIRTVPSVETDLFEPHQLTQFFSQSYQVSNDISRMGIRLDGDAITIHKALNITSSGLTQGSIQIPPLGTPIISSVDGQTVGGYPRIANVIAADLPLLGQLKSGDKLNFIKVSLDYADQLLAHSNQLTMDF